MGTDQHIDKTTQELESFFKRGLQIPKDVVTGQKVIKTGDKKV